jgi:stage V sporulation protein R
VYQPPFDSNIFPGINPYALGFAMFTDLRRICERPDAEDREWFPQLAGSDWKATLDFAMRNFKDESFIAQYLSPRLIREFRLFAIADHESETELGVDCIHDDAGYRRVRKLLSHQHSIEERVPDVQIHRYARDADRSLTLRYRRLRGRPLSGAAAEVLKHVRRLWGFPVRLESVDVDNRVLETLECAA